MCARVNLDKHTSLFYKCTHCFTPTPKIKELDCKTRPKMKDLDCKTNKKDTFIDGRILGHISHAQNRQRPHTFYKTFRNERF